MCCENGFEKLNENHLKFMLKALKETSNGEEFTMICTLNGMDKVCTKDFFETELMAILWCDGILPRRYLKYKIELKKYIPRLLEYYKGLVL